MSNKLASNLKKTVQENLLTKGSRCSDEFTMEEKLVLCQPFCRYLGVFVDFKLSFITHINFVLERLGKQAGIISRLRHCVLRQHLVKFFKTNIKPIIQYGGLIYGCCSYSSLIAYFENSKKNFETDCIQRKTIRG